MLVLVQPIAFCITVVGVALTGTLTIVSILHCYLVSYLVFWLLSEWRTSTLPRSQAMVTHFYRDSLKFGLQAHVSNVVTFINYRLDLYLVGYFLSAAETGQYNLSMQLAERLWLLSFAASLIVFPESAAHPDRPLQLHLMTRRVGATVFQLTALAALVCAACGPFAIPWLFGFQYQAAVIPFLLMLPGIVLWSYMRILANAMAGLGHVNINTQTAFLCLGINVVANLLLIPRFGIAGAALASTLAYAVATLYTMTRYERLMQLKIAAV